MAVGRQIMFRFEYLGFIYSTRNLMVSFLEFKTARPSVPPLYYNRTSRNQSGEEVC